MDQLKHFLLLIFISQNFIHNQEKQNNIRQGTAQRKIIDKKGLNFQNIAWIPSKQCQINIIYSDQSQNHSLNNTHYKCERGQLQNNVNFRQVFINNYYKVIRSDETIKNIGVVRRAEPLIVKSNSGNSIFCAIHKSGSTAWKRVVHKAAGKTKSIYLSKGGRVHSESLTTLGDLDSKAQNQLMNRFQVIRWVVVRNPYARLFSAYHEKLVKGHPAVKSKFHKIFNLKYENEKSASFLDFVRQLYSLYNSSFTQQGVSIRRKSLSVLDGVDPHFAWQTSFCGMQQGFGFDYVLKSEQISEWYPKIIQLLNLSNVVSSGWPGQHNCFLSVPNLQCDGPQLNFLKQYNNNSSQQFQQLHSRGSNTFMLQAYDEEVASMVTEMYENDILGLGYPFWDGQPEFFQLV